MEEQRIANLVFRCAELFESGELEEAAELFNRAHVHISGQQERLSRDALLAYWQADTLLSGGEGFQCLVTNPVIHVDREADSATCSSSYMLVLLKVGGNPQIKETGRYLDEFERDVDGGWHFVAREQQILSGRVPVAPETHEDKQESVSVQKLSPKKRKILEAAQQVFSTVGYSEASIRKIADIVGVSPTILFRHFGTKANLFEQALVLAMEKNNEPAEPATFGRHVADMLADPNQVNCPHAMTILATGNEESREIAIRVLREYAVEPMMKLVGVENRESRAREIMALCAGFALYNSQLNVAEKKVVDQHMVDWLAKSIQAVVDAE